LKLGAVMPKPFHRIVLAVLASLFAGTIGGCSDSATRLNLENLEIENLATESAPSSLQDALTPPSSANPVPATAQLSVPNDSYQRAIDRASRAFALSQLAQSQDDWRLVASRWQQAIDLMVNVPVSSPNHAQAQRKILEYRQNVNYAQKQANHSIGDPTGDTTVVIHAQPETAPPQSSSQPVMPLRSTAPVVTVPTPVAASVPSAIESANVFYAPIVRREGNTPVIQVTFNGQQTFDMIVDTGASGTLITNQMAQALNVVPVAAAMVDTASQRGVTVPLGYVSSISVNGAMANNVLVAIAGPQLSTGLLGHDFFGGYDVTIRENEVEFRER
jgi:predicted aspartyl protease